MKTFYIEYGQDAGLDQLLNAIQETFPGALEIMDCLKVEVSLPEVEPLIAKLANTPGNSKPKKKAKAVKDGPLATCIRCGASYVKATSDYCGKSCAMKAAHERKRKAKEVKVEDPEKEPLGIPISQPWTAVTTENVP